MSTTPPVEDVVPSRHMTRTPLTERQQSFPPFSEPISPRKRFSANLDVPAVDEDAAEDIHFRTPTKPRRSFPTTDDTADTLVQATHLSPYTTSYASSVFPSLTSPSLTPATLRKTARSPLKGTGSAVASPMNSPTKSPTRSPRKKKASTSGSTAALPPPPYSRYNSFTYAVKNQQRVPDAAEAPFPSLFPSVRAQTPLHHSKPTPLGFIPLSPEPEEEDPFGPTTGSLAPAPLVPKPFGVSHAFYDPSPKGSAPSPFAGLHEKKRARPSRPRISAAPIAELNRPYVPKELEACTPILEDAPAGAGWSILIPSPLVLVRGPLGFFARAYAVRDSAAAWMVLYFIFNLGLTLYNKGVLVRFPFPYSLTALHTFCGTIGTSWMWYTGYFVSVFCSSCAKGVADIHRLRSRRS